MSNKNRKTPKTQSGNSWTFSNVILSNEERVAFIKWSDERYDSILELLSETLNAGYKFSVKLNVDTDIHYATLSGNANTWENQKNSLTSRHPEFETAVLLTLYKHYVLCDGGQWREDEQPQEWG